MTCHNLLITTVYCCMDCHFQVESCYRHPKKWSKVLLPYVDFRCNYVAGHRFLDVSKVRLHDNSVSRCARREPPYKTLLIITTL
jgi:hypothetical protein